jgi:uncharacterized protein
MADIAKMYELQKIDGTWERVRRRLGQIKTAMVESEELQAARQQVAATEADLQSWHVQQKNAELESQSLAERIAATEQRLMSGQVRNPKELEALQASLDGLQRLRTTVESQGVEALLKLEELTAQLSQEQTALKTLEGKWTSGQSTLIEEETKLKRAYMQLKKQRESTAATLGETLMKRYETLRQRKGGVAVAPLQNATCGACHVQVPTGVVSAARSQENDNVVCPSCGRILYVG